MIHDGFTAFSLWLAQLANAHLFPVMFLSFGGGLILRGLIYYVMKAEERFCKEFEKRVHRHLDREYPETRMLGFHALTESLLKRTYHEIYFLRDKHRRRNLDRTASVADRILLVEDGSLRLVEDTLKQTKYLEQGNVRPEYESVARFVFGSNPAFTRLAGVFNMAVANDVLNMLPGLFIVGGLLGTFLGIMGGLPQLRGMDISHLESARATLDVFLGQMAYSINTSVVGIILSVSFGLVNALLSPADTHARAIEKFKLSLEFAWNDTLATAAERSPERDPRTVDLERHPEIRAADTAGDDTATPGLPPPLPTSEEQRASALLASTASVPLRGPVPESLAPALAAAALAESTVRPEDPTPITEITHGGFRNSHSFNPAAHEPPAYGVEDRTASIDTNDITDGAGFAPEQHEPPAYEDESHERVVEELAAEAEGRALRESLSEATATAPAPRSFGVGTVNDGDWPVGGGATAANLPWPHAGSELEDRDHGAESPAENVDYDADDAHKGDRGGHGGQSAA